MEDFLMWKRDLIFRFNESFIEEQPCCVEVGNYPRGKSAVRLPSFRCLKLLRGVLAKFLFITIYLPLEKSS